MGDNPVPDEITLYRVRAIQCMVASLIWRICAEIPDCQNRQRGIDLLNTAKDIFADIILGTKP